MCMELHVCYEVFLKSYSCAQQPRMSERVHDKQRKTLIDNKPYIILNIKTAIKVMYMCTDFKMVQRLARSSQYSKKHKANRYVNLPGICLIRYSVCIGKSCIAILVDTSS